MLYLRKREKKGEQITAQYNMCAIKKEAGLPKELKGSRPQKVKVGFTASKNSISDNCIFVKRKIRILRYLQYGGRGARHECFECLLNT